MVTSLKTWARRATVIGMTSNLRYLPVLFFSFFCLSQTVDAEYNFCAFQNDERDWGVLRFSSATTAIETVETHCEQGDHLMISHMKRWDVGYFVAVACDPSFEITLVDLDSQYVSLNCVYAGSKLDRFE